MGLDNHALRITEVGGPEVLQWVEAPFEPPAAGEIALRQTFAGVNFADTMQRSGAAPVRLPAILGLDGVGIVEETGASVDNCSVGDRIAYTMLPGAYVRRRCIAAGRAVRLPDDVADDVACALISKGLTARYLLHDLRTLEAGTTILVHAASGGVGSLLCQWAASLGIDVIGTVSTPEKAAYAAARGCRHVLVRAGLDLAEAVNDLTGGARAEVVFDSLGQSTFMASLDCLRPRGLMVSYGAATGRPPAIAVEELGRRGALFLTQSGLLPYIATPQMLAAAADELWQALREGRIAANIEHRFPAEQGAEAHRRLESGQQVGASILAF